MGLFKLDGNAPQATVFARYWLPVCILLGCLLLVIGGEIARERLQFERTAIGTGEYWRLVSGHFVHLGTSHFLLNAGGVALVWFLTGRFLDWYQWVLAMVFAIVVIDLGLWHLNPDLQWYVGLSGLLHGLLATGIVVGVSGDRRELQMLAGLLLVKVAWEQFAGPLPGSETASGGPVVVDAHLYGIVAGVLAGLAGRIRVRGSASI